MQSSSLPAAATPLASLLEPAQSEATPVVTAEASTSGAFETVINQAVGEAADNSNPSKGAGGNTQTENAKKTPTATAVVEGENESESEESVDSRASEKGAVEEAKANLVCVLPDALACNLLLQVTPVPVVNTPSPVAAEPTPLPTADELVPEQTTARPLPSKPVGTQSQDVGTISPARSQGEAANLQTPPLGGEKASNTPTPFQSKEAIAKSLTPLPVAEAQPKVDSTANVIKQDATTVQTTPEQVVAAETRPQVTMPAAMPRMNSEQMVQKSPVSKPEPRLKVIIPEGQPIKESTNLAPSEPDGTSTAKSTQTMQNAAETGRRMQSLPGKTGKPATLPQSVDAAPAKTPAPVGNETATPSPRGDVSMFVSDAAPLRTELGTKELSSKGIVSLEQVEGQIRTQVVEFKRIGSDSMSVVLKPDAQVELHVQLRMERGQVHVVVECKRGDVAALNEAWGQLQQNLAGQGIRVSALQDGSGTNLANGNWTGQFQRQGWQEHQKWEGPSYRYFGDDEKATSGRSFSAPNGKVTNPSTKLGEKRSLEMWA